MFGSVQARRHRKPTSCRTRTRRLESPSMYTHTQRETFVSQNTVAVETSVRTHNTRKKDTAVVLVQKDTSKKRKTTSCEERATIKNTITSGRNYHHITPVMSVSEKQRMRTKNACRQEIRRSYKVHTRTN